MVFQILQTKQQVRQPLLNEQGNGMSFDDMKRYISKRIMNQIKVTPELVGMLDTLVAEHFQGPIDYFSPDGKSLGPTQLKKAKKFWTDNKIKQVFQGMGFDYFSDGSCFGWVGTAGDEATIMYRRAAEHLKTKFGGTSVSDMIRTMIDEELERPRKISYLAASTVEIIHDDYSPLVYKQEASGKEIMWAENQIVHIKLMEFNGEARSFSGLKALINEITVMYMVKENLIAKLENGGSADNIIAIKNTVGSGKTRFNRLRTALESFSHIKKSHGNMPIDGEVTVHPLSAAIKDMEYRELAMFVISEFCLALGLPVSRIPFLGTGQGGPTNKGEMSANADAPYDEKKNSRRATWEDAWNSVFEKAAGFHFKFRRTNLQDDVRETTASMNRASFVGSVQANLAKDGLKLTKQAHLELISGTKMNICSEDVEKLPEQTIQEPQSPRGKAMTPSKQELQSPAKSVYEQAKEGSAKNNGVYA